VDVPAEAVPALAVAVLAAWYSDDGGSKKFSIGIDSNGAADVSAIVPDSLLTAAVPVDDGDVT
jgi:hypothetical protein